MLLPKSILIALSAATWSLVSAHADPATASPPAPTPYVQPAPGLHMPDAPAAPASTPQRQEDSASYVSGYSDGCASANLRYARQEHVKPNKDPKLYETDADYHAGWDHGYRKCEDRVTPGGISVPGNSVVM